MISHSLTVQSVTDKLASLSKEVEKRVVLKESLCQDINSLEAALVDIAAESSAYEKSIWLLQQYAELQQKEITDHVEALVTKGLIAVFQNPSMKFHLTYSENKKGGKKKTPEMSMSVSYLINDERVYGDIKNSFGGGLSVVVSLLLRIVVTLYLSPRVSPILLLDEPLKDLSPAYDGQDETSNGYRERMAEFLRQLCNETGVQLIIVTHEPEYGKLADVHHKFFGGVGKHSKVTTTRNTL